MPDDALIWRMGVFIGLIIGLVLLERLIPKRRLSQTLSLRWVSNLGIFLVDSVLTRVLVAAGGIAAAAYAAKMGWGLFNLVSLPDWAALIVTILVLDFAVWLQHVMSHRWDWFWRLHRMHHSDLDIDVTTALRFHPLEILVSLIYKSAVIVALGAPLMAVLVFEILLNGCAMFNHANIALPKWLDRLLRPVIVTPDMHRVHHSSDERETKHNYGFCLSWWDRFFGLYTAQPRKGHAGMEIGLDTFRTREDQTFGPLLLQPFRKTD